MITFWTHWSRRSSLSFSTSSLSSSSILVLYSISFIFRSYLNVERLTASLIAMSVSQSRLESANTFHGSYFFRSFDRPTLFYSCALAKSTVVVELKIELLQCVESI